MEQSNPKVHDLALKIDLSDKPLVLVFNELTVLLTTDRNSVLVNRAGGGLADFSAAVSKSEPLFNLSKIIWCNTRRDLTHKAPANDFNVLTVYRILKHICVSCTLGKRAVGYQEFLDRVAELGENVYTVTADDLVMTFAYSNEELHLKSQIPGVMRVIDSFGKYSNLGEIADVMVGHYHRMNIENYPEHHELIEMLSNA